MAGHTRMWPTNSPNEALRLDMSMNRLGITSSQISRLAFIAGIAIFVVLTYWVSYSNLMDLWQRTDPIAAKSWQVAALVLRRPADGRFVVMETPVIDNVDEARRRLERAGRGLLGHARSASLED